MEKMKKKLSNEDWWLKRFRGGWSPYSRIGMTSDINEVLKEIKEVIRKEFQNSSQESFKQIINERQLSNEPTGRNRGAHALVDVLEIDGEIKIIAELPEVGKEDIELHGRKSVITISVDTPQQKYYKEIEMPTQINPKQAKSTYKNGVLKIIVPKKQVETPKGEKIEIEYR